MDISIGIVNWNTKDDLRLAIETLKAHGVRGTYEIVVVDNASTDGSPEMVEQNFPDVHLIRNPRNVGFGAAHNQAFKAGSGRFRLAINPDSHPHPGAINELTEFADHHPEAGIVGPKLVNPDGSLQYSCRRFPSVGAAIFRNALFDRILPGNRLATDYLMRDWDHASPREVDWVSGAAMLLRGEVVEKVGGFDERFFMYCEDTDICKRAWQAGWKVLYSPDAVFTHTIGRSTDAAPNRMTSVHHASMYKYYKKYTAAETPIWVRPLVPVGLLVRSWATITRNLMNILRRAKRR